MTEERPAPTGAHPVAVYTALRAAIFVVPFVVLLVVGVQLVWALLIAALASSLASVFLLSKQRDQMSIALSGRSERMRQRMAEREAAEDEWDDARRASDLEMDSGEPPESGGPPSS